MRAANKSLCGDREPRISKSFFAPHIGLRERQGGPDDHLACPSKKIRLANCPKLATIVGVPPSDPPDDDDENEEDEDDDDEEDEQPAVFREPDEC